MKLFRNAVYATLLLAASTCFAQTTAGDVVADIPFPFVVSGKTLPAGHYIVSPVNASTVRIRVANDTGMFVPTGRAQRSWSDNSCKLVFHRYEGTYFLSQIWSAGTDRGRELFRSSAEREMAARAASKPNTVLAAK